MDELKRILIVSHDAGGAEVISSWIKHHREYDYTFVLAGPAIPIFKRKLGEINFHSENQLSEQILFNDLILTGTSGEANLERNAIRFSLDKNKKVISYLDHWCEYRERFLHGDRLILPKEIWVGDQYAYEIAKACFVDVNIKLVKNYYFEDFQKELPVSNQRIQNKKLRLLYNCEPIASYAEKMYGSANYFNYTEYTALNYFFQFIETTNYKHDIDTIRIRLHPLEKKDKYDDIIGLQKGHCITLSDTSLLEDILWTDWMVGCSSMALVLGILAGKKVFTCNPPNAKVFNLPHKEIHSLPNHLNRENYG